MKTTLKTILTYIFFLLALGACQKDDDKILLVDTFSVKVTQNMALPYIVTSKDDIVFDLMLKSAAEVKLKDAMLSLDGNDLHTVSANGNEATLQYTYQVADNDIGKSLIFRLKISDEKGRSIDKDFTIYVQSAPANIGIEIPSQAPSEIRDDEFADFNISVTSENDIKYIKTFVDQIEIPALTKETFVDPKADTYNFVYQPTVADADKTLAFTIEVMDVMGNIIKQNYSLKVIRSQVADFNYYIDVNLGGQRSTGPGPFFNAATGEVYVTTGAVAKAADIDLVTFFSGSTTAFNLASPKFANNIIIYTVAGYGNDAIENWAVRNLTLIKKLTTLTRGEFDLVNSAAEIEALYTSSSVTASETSGGLANNNVIVFKTAADKYGLLYVKSRSENKNTGYLTVDIKMEK